MQDPDPTFIVATIGAIGAVWAALVTRRLVDNSAWSAECQAYRHWELGANRDAFLQIHGLSEEKLREFGMSKDTFREYQLFLNTLWEASRYRKGIDRLRAEPDYVKKIEIARGITWKKSTRSGQILASKEFQAAWELLKTFWSTEVNATTGPLIEASIQLSRESKETT
ncbi:MAG: hypothetical protein KDC10_14500 [Calditrichaeota bacterium]|nr:hypothetical protein [Calditrichota bacterium]